MNEPAPPQAEPPARGRELLGPGPREVRPGPARPSTPARWLERSAKRALSRLLAACLRPRPATPADLEPSRIRHLLVVRQHNQMGDMVCALPALHALRRRYPRAHLTFVAAPLTEELLAGHPDIDTLLVFRKQDMWQPRRAAAFLRALGRPRPDLAVVMTTVSFSTTSALLAWASRARLRAGGSSLPFGSYLSRALYHLELPPAPEGVPEVEHNLSPLAALGIELGITPPRLEPALAAVSRARERIAAWFPSEAASPAPPGPLVVAHAGAGKLPNVWPAERFATVLAALQRERGARVVLTEGPSDTAIVSDLAAKLPSARRWRAPLGDTLGLLAGADVVLCNDTGMSHVAAAIGVPTVVLFGPTDPVRWRPPGSHVHAVCSPTGSILEVDVAAVLRAVHAALEGNASRPLA